MIKGCSRKVVVVKNTGSDLFEEAYFILKPSADAFENADFLAEAKRIIASRTGYARRSRAREKRLRRLKNWMFILLGASLGVGLSTLVLAVFRT